MMLYSVSDKTRLITIGPAVKIKKPMNQGEINASPASVSAR
jgi:hypothetical protein